MSCSPQITWVVDKSPGFRANYLTRTLAEKLSSNLKIEAFESIKPSLSETNRLSYFLNLEQSMLNEQIKKIISEIPAVVYLHDILELPAFACGSIVLAPTERAVALLKSQLSSGGPTANPQLGGIWCLPYPVDELQLALAPKANTAPGLLSIALVGGSQPEYRAPHVIRTLSNLDCPWTVFWLCPESEIPGAGALCEEFCVTEKVHLIHGEDPAQWATILGKTNLAIHLWFSAFADPFPYLSMSLMSGVPVCVHSFSTTTELPRTAAFHLELGFNESSDLSAVFERVASGQAAEVGRIGQDFARENYSVTQFAAELKRIFDKAVFAGDFSVARVRISTRQQHV